MRRLLILTLCIISLCASAQVNQKIFSGGSSLVSNEVKVVNNNEYIIRGSTNGGSLSKQNTFLTRLDSNLNVVWSKTFGSNNDDGYFISRSSNLVVKEDAITFITTTESQTHDELDLLLVSVNHDGDTIFTNRFIDSIGLLITALVAKPDSGFYLIGSDGFAPNNLVLMSLNKTGDIEWQKEWLYEFNLDYSLEVTNAKVDPNGDIVAILDRSSVVKINSSGDMLFYKKYGIGLMDFYKTTSGYIFTGNATGSILVGKADDDWNLSNAKRIYQNASNQDMCKLNNGNYLVVGTSGDSIDLGVAIEIDSNLSVVNGYEYSLGEDLTIYDCSSSGNYSLLVGTKGELVTDRKLWVLKTNSSLSEECNSNSISTVNFSTGLSTTLDTLEVGVSNVTTKRGCLVGTFDLQEEDACIGLSVFNEMEPLELKIYPNPSKNVISLNVNGSLKIYDLTGNVMYFDNSYNKNFEIDVSKFKSGIYLIQLNDEGSLFQSNFIKD